MATQTYTPRGQIAGIGLDGGTVASYEYSPVGTTTAKNIEPLLVGTSGEDCRRQPVGRDERERASQNRLTSATVNGVTTEFTYDSRNRVVQRTSGNGTLKLTYSGWNLIEERNGGGELEQVYVHGAGRLASTTYPAAMWSRNPTRHFSPTLWSH